MYTILQKKKRKEEDSLIKIKILSLYRKLIINDDLI